MRNCTLTLKWKRLKQSRSSRHWNQSRLRVSDETIWESHPRVRQGRHDEALGEFPKRKKLKIATVGMVSLAGPNDICIYMYMSTLGVRHSIWLHFTIQLAGLWPEPQWNFSLGRRRERMVLPGSGHGWHIWRYVRRLAEWRRIANWRVHQPIKQVDGRQHLWHSNDQSTDSRTAIEASFHARFLFFPFIFTFPLCCGFEMNK